MKINVTNIKLRMEDIASSFIDQGIDLRTNQSNIARQAIKEYLEDNFDIPDSKIHSYISKAYNLIHEKVRMSNQEIEKLEFEVRGTDIYNDLDDVISNDFDEINYAPKGL